MFLNVYVIIYRLFNKSRCVFIKVGVILLKSVCFVRRRPEVGRSVVFLFVLVLFRCCRSSSRPLPLGDVFSSTRRCANCRRDQKGRIQTMYLLYTPKIDSNGRQNGAHIAKKWVENQIQNKNLQNNFILLGARPLETMPSYYSLSDVLLASFKKDPLFSITVPAKIQSYLPSGKPILASMDGEGAEIVERAGAGFGCPAGDVHSLVENILKLYKMPKEERKNMGLKGRSYFFENFERELLLNKLEMIMENRV